MITESQAVWQFLRSHQPPISNKTLEQGLKLNTRLRKQLVFIFRCQALGLSPQDQGLHKLVQAVQACFCELEAQLKQGNINYNEGDFPQTHALITQYLPTSIPSERSFYHLIEYFYGTYPCSGPLLRHPKPFIKPLRKLGIERSLGLRVLSAKLEQREYPHPDAEFALAKLLYNSIALGTLDKPVWFRDLLVTWMHRSIGEREHRVMAIFQQMQCRQWKALQGVQLEKFTKVPGQTFQEFLINSTIQDLAYRLFGPFSDFLLVTTGFLQDIFTQKAIESAKIDHEPIDNEAIRSDVAYFAASPDLLLKYDFSSLPRASRHLLRSLQILLFYRDFYGVSCEILPSLFTMILCRDQGGWDPEKEIPGFKERASPPAANISFVESWKYMLQCLGSVVKKEIEPWDSERMEAVVRDPSLFPLLVHLHSRPMTWTLFRASAMFAAFQHQPDISFSVRLLRNFFLANPDLPPEKMAFFPTVVPQLLQAFPTPLSQDKIDVLFQRPVFTVNAQDIPAALLISKQLPCSDIERFDIFVELLVTGLKYVASISTFLHHLASFSSTLRSEHIHFLYRYHPELPFAELKELIALKEDILREGIGELYLNAEKTNAFLQQVKSLVTKIVEPCLDLKARDDIYRPLFLELFERAIHFDAQPVIDFLKIRGPQFRWRHPSLATHRGQLKFISNSQAIYLRWGHDPNGALSLFCLVYYAQHASARAAQITLQVPRTELDKLDQFVAEKHDTPFMDLSLFIENCSGYLFHDAPNGGRLTPQKIQDSAQTDLRPDLVSPENIDQIVQFLRELKIAYRSLFHPRFVLDSFENQSYMEIAAQGNLYEGALLPPYLMTQTLHPECYLPDMSEDWIQRWFESSPFHPNGERQKLDLDLTVQQGSEIVRFPIYFQTIERAEDDPRGPEQYSVLSAGDVEVELRYDEHKPSYAKLHNLMLKSAWYRLNTQRPRSNLPRQAAVQNGFRASYCDTSRSSSSPEEERYQYLPESKSPS